MINIEGEKKVILGGCIENRTPLEKSDGCQCYQVSFKICYELKVYHVSICREWLRYVTAQRHRLLKYSRNDSQPRIDGAIIKELILERFHIRDKWHATHLFQVRSKTISDIIRPIGYIPSHIVETVVCNKYCTIHNAIPVSRYIEMLSSTDINEWGKVTSPYLLGTEICRYPSKHEEDLIYHNKKYIFNVNKVIEKLCTWARLNLKLYHDKYGNTKEEVAAVLLAVAAKEKKIDNRQKNTTTHEANKPKESLPPTL